ncbi:MAG TPA: FAD-linked oxidase C-terminal domain-containing protein, partial [Ktedonobacterales bacterium]|nr:FAD-linked oxidase C-terminal domain-containing protein [Ktedonobacterales bacterium]
TVIDVARDTCMEHEIRLCWSADAAAGIGWLRIVRDDGDEEHFSAGLRALQVMLARRWRNAIVVGCSSALRRHLPLWGADPQGLELMRAIKSQFDPAGILNLGRFG